MSRLLHVTQGHEREHEQHARVGVAGSPEVLPELVVSVPWFSYEQREDTGPAVDHRGHQELPGAFKSFVRHSIPAAAVLFPAAFFLSVLSPEATEPNALINLAYVGAVSLAAGLLVLAPVALSGLVLAFTPVWWIFPTYLGSG